MPVKVKEAEEFPAMSLALSDATIIAFDPGETTGVCLFDGGKLISCTTADEITLIEACRRLGHPYFAKLKLPDRTFKAIVVERFTLYPGMALKMINNSFVAAQAIGMIRIFASYHLTDITYQAASHAKNLVTDDVLRTYDWYKKIKNIHERDAVRHAVYYLNKLHRKENG